jgi:Ca2+-binding RTX toxin-like protein
VKRLRYTLTIGIAIAGVAAIATPASAAVTCSLSSGKLSVSISGDGTEVIDITERPNGNFRVSTWDAGTIACAGGPATTANTDLIDVVDSSGASSDTTLSLWGVPFLGGATDEGDGTSEVEVSATVGTGTDDLRLFALTGPVNFRLGTLGVNTNTNETSDDLDVDVPNMADLETAAVAGSDSADVISGAGGEGAGLEFPHRLRIDALAGNDDIRGGAAQNFLIPYAGDDTVDCSGSLSDILDFSFGPTVSVDLEADTATGDGTDAILGACESVGGSNGPDVLRGESGSQFLFGRLGDDVLEGRSGNDFLYGEGSGCATAEGDSDTVSYESAPDGVDVDLDAGSGGSPMTGNDLYCDIDNVIGGDQADDLLGDGTPNVLTGRGGDDTLNGRGGPDTADYAANPTAIEADLVSGTVLGASTDTLTSIERVVGTPFGDIVEGNGGTNRFRGLGGADRLVGLAGRDQLDGGSGGDDLLGGAGNDRVLGRAGADLLNGRPNIDFCKGGPGADTRRSCERGSG